jgi:hypothetical protein
MSKDAGLALSFLHPSGQDAIFFSGIVGAEMKKQVTYNVKLVVGVNGEVKNSHCECPAGQGPHATCKHITCILIILHKFVESGELRVAKSCTETLQSFKKPRRMHDGGPIQADKLGPGIIYDVMFVSPLSAWIECFRTVILSLSPHLCVAY